MIKNKLPSLITEYLEHATFRAARSADMEALKKLRKMGIQIGDVREKNNLSPAIALILSTTPQLVEERKKVLRFILKHTSDVNSVYFNRHAADGQKHSTLLDVAERCGHLTLCLIIRRMGGKSYFDLEDEAQKAA